MHQVPHPGPTQQLGALNDAGGAGGRGGVDGSAAGRPGTPHVAFVWMETSEKVSEVTISVGVVLVTTVPSPLRVQGPGWLS